MVWFSTLLAVIFVILCILIILIVLIQPGQSGGLAGTFGSGGMLGSAFGVQMKNRLSKLTTIMVILFFGIIFIFALAFRKNPDETPFDEGLEKKSFEAVPAPDEAQDQKPDESSSPVVEEVVPVPEKETEEKAPESSKEKSPVKKPE